MMPIAAKLDEWGKPAWIAAVVLGFMVWWPIGLMTLAFAFGSGRMGRGQFAGFSGWKGCGDWKSNARQWHRSSGNAAFDEYRNETLKRLEDEEREFRDFLERLRQAKDKHEFDQFMADRRSRQTPTNDTGEHA